MTHRQNCNCAKCDAGRKQQAYRESRRQWALDREQPYPEDGGRSKGRAPDPERMKLQPPSMEDGKAASAE